MTDCIIYAMYLKVAMLCQLLIEGIWYSVKCHRAKATKCYENSYFVNQPIKARELNTHKRTLFVFVFKYILYLAPL